MSLNIHELPGAVLAPGAVAPVPLSERVEARQSESQPPPQLFSGDGDLPPAETDAPEVEYPESAEEAYEPATRDQRVAFQEAHRPTGGKAKMSPPSLLVTARPGVSPDPQPPAATVVATPSTPAGAVPAPPVPTTVTLPAPAAASASPGALVPSSEGAAAAPAVVAEGDARNAPPAATTHRPHALGIAQATPYASRDASQAASAAPGHATATATQPAATERSAVPESPSTPAPVMAPSPQQQGGEAGTDGQSLADARRAEANVGTRQHVRAVRQAEALQTAMAARADTASQIHVSFNTWGSGHSVTARLEGGRLHMQPSSARVGQALAAAPAPAGAELLIAVEGSDSATEERSRRRGGQGHA